MHYNEIEIGKVYNLLPKDDNKSIRINNNKSIRVLVIYKSTHLGFNPRIIFINLNTNIGGFSVSLNEFVSLSDDQKHNIKIHIPFEPQQSLGESNFDRIKSLEKQLETITQERDILTIQFKDLQEFFQQFKAQYDEQKEKNIQLESEAAHNHEVLKNREKVFFQMREVINNLKCAIKYINNSHNIFINTFFDIDEDE